MPLSTTRSPEFFNGLADGGEPLPAELARGLAAQPASLSPKFLYDPLGSALFVAITELDEYYPTRTEAMVMSRHGQAIADAARQMLGESFALVDLGAGNGAKAERLFGLLQPARYVAVDFAIDFLRPALTALQQRHPGLPMAGVALDFSRRLVLPEGVHDGHSLVFYPGSSIGNFAPDEAERLLREARLASRGGALLIGADLVKPVDVLEAAYDDALGVTAAFNLNLLRHVNRLLGSDFDPRDWQHLALFDSARSRIEMHLQARRSLQVCWPGGARRFEAGERIHTENSYKWTLQTFDALLRAAGWHDVQAWTDERSWFGVFLARA